MPICNGNDYSYFVPDIYVAWTLYGLNWPTNYNCLQLLSIFKFPELRTKFQCQGTHSFTCERIHTHKHICTHKGDVWMPQLNLPLPSRSVIIFHHFKWLHSNQPNLVIKTAVIIRSTGGHLVILFIQRWQESPMSKYFATPR